LKAEFLGWYEAVTLSIETDVAEARWAAVEALAASATYEELEALTRAAFRAKHTSAKTAAVRAKLSEKGGAIQDEEFKLLAAATLAGILRTSQPTAALAATMIGTTHLDGLRPVKQPVDIIGPAASTRLALARTTRRRPPLMMAPMPELDVDATEAVESEDPNESLELLATACTTVIESLAQRQSEFERRAMQYIAIQDEELNMLWWLQSGHSHTLDQPFAEIPREQRPFVLARELAEATYAIPGVAAVESLLARAGVDDAEPVGIAAAIQALPLDWLKTAIPEADCAKVSSVTTPLHEAFKRRLEVEGQDTWIANWASVCNIDPASKLSPLRLADLCYCEQLVICK
jgi:hypothetical protein